MVVVMKEHLQVEARNDNSRILRYNQSMQNEAPVLYATPEERWQAVQSRDTRADGWFFYGVVTTGVYCRPGCASRRPNRANVRFFDNPEQAEQAGLKPCKRCRPDLAARPVVGEEAIRRACALMDEAEQCPKLPDLAAEVGLSPFYFQRLFKQQVGVTPRQYFMQTRARRVQDRLQQGESVTSALYEAGFGSSGHFYGQAAEILGMTPGDYQNGGRGARIFYTTRECYLGWVLIAATSQGICAVEFGDSPESLVESFKQRFSAAELNQDDPQFAGWVDQVLALIDHPERGETLPLDIQGTAFQRRVWQALREIPSGSTITYSDLAQRIGQPSAVRAVAHACATNEIALVIPCHRVVRTGGALGGYRWGLERKERLLKREKQA